jgi:Protein of unknown function (DUF3226)
MVQRLLVEGDSDIHFVANLCKTKGIPLIKGYEAKRKLEQEFFEEGEGVVGLKRKIPLILKEEDLTNFGIILDANSKPAQSEWDSLKTIFKKAGFRNLPAAPNLSGTIFIQEGKPKVGIWIMPNNRDSGYLEFFLEKMIPEEDDLIRIAKNATQSLIARGINRFTEIKKQKADVHTWLAWQPSPGLPYGTAISADYFDLDAGLVNIFVAWLQNVFEFSDQTTFR